MDFYNDINTTVIRTHNLQAIPENGISPLDINNTELDYDAETPYNTIKNEDSINRPISRSAPRISYVGICFYGSEDMIHGYLSGAGGIFANDKIPYNHLDHNRNEYDSGSFSGPFVQYHDAEVYAESMKGKLLICFGLDDEMSPPKWCEVATVCDIPPIIPVYCYYDEDINIDVIPTPDTEIVKTEYDQIL